MESLLFLILFSPSNDTLFGRVRKQAQQLPPPKLLRLLVTNIGSSLLFASREGGTATGDSPEEPTVVRQKIAITAWQLIPPALFFPDQQKNPILVILSVI